MKRLTPLNTDPTYHDRYVAIRDRKKLSVRRKLIAADTFVEDRYKAFSNAIQGGTLTAFAMDERAMSVHGALRACYDSPTKLLKELKDAIETAQPKRLLTRCPMCGTTLPRTHDHYLPAVKFPELAVHPLNLVPCCSACNSIKGDDWLCDMGRRQYLHAYSDEVPEAQFVQVKLHRNSAFSTVGATFSLVKPANVGSNIWRLVESHFTRLNLIERYNELGNDEVSEILSDCASYLKSGGSNVREFLVHCAHDRRSVYGCNHWIAVLMRTLAEHDDLETWAQLPR